MGATHAVRQRSIERVGERRREEEEAGAFDEEEECGGVEVRLNNLRIETTGTEEEVA